MENGDWGNCPKCGNALDMHYTVWCPSCEIPEPKKRMVYDFFKTARYIARQEGIVNEGWEQDVLQQLDYPRNDSYIQIYPGLDNTASELGEYCKGLCNHYDINTNEPIILEISW
jgi:hypothetical protein